MATCVLFILLLCTIEGNAKLEPVSTDDLADHLEAAFSYIRCYNEEENKQKTRDYLQTFFEELANKNPSVIKYHDFKFTDSQNSYECRDNTCPAVNYLYIIPGERYGTSEDKLTMIGTHYDSREDTPGVDDNGSGMAALLESARIISEFSRSCQLKNSVAFAAFDWEEFDNLLGSRTFLEEYFVPLLANLSITEDSFGGAIILDTVMNWDPEPFSQQLPAGFELAFPDLDARLKEQNYSGNFITVISRTDDRLIGDDYKRIWETLLFPDLYRAEEVPLPVGGRPDSWPIDIRFAFNNFLRSDHKSFWNYGTGNGLKAIFLTDTANFRGHMKSCYHNPCDDLSKVTPQKLKFLAKITDALVQYQLEKATEEESPFCSSSDISKAASTVNVSCPMLLVTFVWYTFGILR